MNEREAPLVFRARFVFFGTPPCWLVGSVTKKSLDAWKNKTLGNLSMGKKKNKNIPYNGQLNDPYYPPQQQQGQMNRNAPSRQSYAGGDYSGELMKKKQNFMSFFSTF